MSKKKAAKNPGEIAKDTLFAMLEAFLEKCDDHRRFDDVELYALVSAFEQVKPYLDKEAVADFAKGVLRIVDMDAVRSGADPNYSTTFDSFIEAVIL